MTLFVETYICSVDFVLHAATCGVSNSSCLIFDFISEVASSLHALWATFGLSSRKQH